MKYAALVWLCLWLLVTGCATAVTPTPAPTPAPTPSANCAAGSFAEEITSSGQTRQYRLHIPPTYQAGKPAPLVFGFHGAGKTAEQYESYSGFSALADREGFIAVYPQALGALPSWNTGGGANNADVQLTRDLIDSLAARCTIAPARIYATGFSLGGGMANRLACSLADHITAIGSVSGAYEARAGCSPSRPVAVVAFHGTADSNIPYDGIGNADGGHGPYFSVSTPIPQWAADWAARNGCRTAPYTIFQKGALSGQAWRDCRAGADVVLYTVQGGEHSWPGGDINAAQMIWDFFTREFLKPQRP